MADMAALADVDVASGQLDGIIGPRVDARRVQRFLEKAGQDLYQAADGRNEQDAEDQQPGVFFQLAMQVHGIHACTSCADWRSAGEGMRHSSGTGGTPASTSRPPR